MQTPKNGMVTGGEKSALLFKTVQHAAEPELAQAKNQSPSMKRFLKGNLNLPKVKKTPLLKRRKQKIILQQNKEQAVKLAPIRFTKKPANG